MMLYLQLFHQPKGHFTGVQQPSEWKNWIKCEALLGILYLMLADACSISKMSKSSRGAQKCLLNSW